MESDHEHDEEETKGASRRAAFTVLDQVASDFALAIALQEQERAFTTVHLPTIPAAAFLNDDVEDETEDDDLEDETEDEEEDSSSDQDFFFPSHGMEEDGLGFLEEEEEEEDMEMDEIDPDELSYEELIALGEIVGEENRGLSMEEIDACLVPYKHKSLHSSDKTGVVDRCVICQIEYNSKEDDNQEEEEEEKVVALPCQHPYHADCIIQWLQIKKTCPICTTEVLS